MTTQYPCRLAPPPHKSLPSSVYCRAISATASAVLLRTLALVSELRACKSLFRIASRCGAISVRKSSLLTGDWSLEVGSFRVRFETRRNSTAANERVYFHVSCVVPSQLLHRILPTAGSSAPSICSLKPMSRISGREFVHSSLSCDSDCVRSTLSGDCRPCSSCARAWWTSGGSCDMVTGCAQELEGRFRAGWLYAGMLRWARTRN